MSPRQPDRIRPLSARQHEILRLLALPGANRKTVAHELGISPKTVEAHLFVAHRRLGVTSDLQAWAITFGPKEIPE